MDAPDYIKFVVVLIFVLSLMGGLALVMKRIGPGGGSLISTGKRRIRIVETLPLDARRRAVLIRRDDREHLVILGPSGETVVESNIQPVDDDKI